ncbi:MAG: LysR family transcriptional regulator [Bdellovibrionota bacterium]|mgnify:CR=1 FL=1
MKIEDLNSWQAFISVAKFGNFSKAANILNLSLPQISKRISSLEEALGVRLFQRSTRVVKITEEGKALLPKAEMLLSDAASMENLFDSKKEKPTGTVRISAVPFLADQILVPLIQMVKTKYPEIFIELDLSEKFVDLVDSNIDIALRIDSDPVDSNLVYKKLFPNELVCCASPKYLKSMSKPIKTPKDLIHHKVLAMKIHNKCRFGNSNVKVGDIINSNLVSCESGWFLRQLARKDLGILIRSTIDVGPLIKSGQLVPILQSYPLGAFGNVYAVIPSRRLLAPRVRVVLGLINEIKLR